MSFDHKGFLPTLPEMPGVYRMCAQNGEVLYVGKAKNLKKRVSSYFQKTLSSPRIAMMVSQIAAIETTVTRSEAEALLLENNLIKRLSPRYNILFRDDKSYPYIVITRDVAPRLGFFRGNPDRKADYFGPFPSASAVRDSVQLLQKMFRLRTCEDSVFAHRSRPCLLYQIKRCSAPCVDLVSTERYRQDVQHAAWFLSGRHGEVLQHLSQKMEQAAAELAFEQAALYRDQMQSLRQVQEKQYIESHRSEDVDVIVAVQENGLTCINLAMIRGGRHLGDRPLFPEHVGASTLEEVCGAFIAQHYATHPMPGRVFAQPLPEDLDELLEGLGGLAERLRSGHALRSNLYRIWVDMALQNARLAITARSQASVQQVHRLEALRDALALEELPRRIECFDISHTQGESPVASCVVYQDDGMRRSDYRRFNIHDIEPGDDYAAIRQAVSRRYGKLASAEAGSLPDLVLIDGGKGQVAVAADALGELGLGHLPLVGVSKGEARKVGLESLVFPDEREPLLLGLEHPALLLVIEIRDEAHRFALTGHRSRRAKPRQSSRLEDIPGVGPSRRKALLSHFGGLAGVANASVDQLASVAGISPRLAETIYAALH